MAKRPAKTKKALKNRPKKHVSDKEIIDASAGMEIRDNVQANLGDIVHQETIGMHERPENMPSDQPITKADQFLKDTFLPKGPSLDLKPQMPDIKPQMPDKPIIDIGVMHKDLQKMGENLGKLNLENFSDVNRDKLTNNLNELQELMNSLPKFSSIKEIPDSDINSLSKQISQVISRTAFAMAEKGHGEEKIGKEIKDYNSILNKIFRRFGLKTKAKTELVTKLKSADKSTFNYAKEIFGDEIYNILGFKKNNIQTDFNEAVNSKNIENLKTLIKLGADIDATDSKKNTALHTAASQGYTKTVKALMEEGADLGKQNGFGKTALHLAAEKGHIKTVIALIEKNPDIVNKTDRFKNTALHLAAEKRYENIVEVLIKARANQNAENIFGKIPLKILKKKKDTFKVLRKAQDDKNIDVKLKAKDFYKTVGRDNTIPNNIKITKDTVKKIFDQFGIKFNEPTQKQFDKLKDKETAESDKFKRFIKFSLVTFHPDKTATQSKEMDDFIKLFNSLK